MKARQFVEEMASTQEFVDIGNAIDSANIQELMPFVQPQYIMQKALFGIHHNDIVIMQHANSLDILPHSHDFFEIQYISAGSIHEEINGKPVDLTEGTFTIFNKNTIHTISRAAEGTRMDYILIHERIFDGRFLAGLGVDNTICCYIVNSLNGTIFDGRYLSFQTYEKKFASVIEELRAETRWKWKDHKHLEKLLLSMLFIQLDRLSSEGIAESHANRAHQSLIFDVEDYISDHYQTASLSDCAATLHLNPSYLCRVVKQVSGKSFTDMLYAKRLEKAETLLVYSDMTIEAIAESVGYSNPVFFYKLFQRKHNMTPKSYRSLSLVSVSETQDTIANQ